MSLREITVGDVPVRALRVTYVGELGWELYCPAEYGLGLWRALWRRAARTVWWRAATAIDSLRLEKGYRVWGADITPDETPYEGGLGFCVKDKEGGFIGREALVEAAERGPRASLCCLTLEDPLSVALGNEPVRIGGEVAGRVTTGVTATPLSARSPTRTCPPSTPRQERRWRSRSSGAGSPARCRASRPGSGRQPSARLVAVGTEAVCPGNARSRGRQASGETLREGALATEASGRRGCAGALHVLSHEPHRAARVALSSRPTSRRCWAFELLSTSSGWAMWAIRSLICPGPRSWRPRAAGRRPRRDRCGSARRPAGTSKGPVVAFIRSVYS